MEAVDVPELAQEQPHGLSHRIDREAVAVPGLLGGEEVPAKRVGAEAVDHLPGNDDVAERLRHLAALAVDEQPEADDVSVRGAVVEQRRDRDQRVEPAARLIKRLADEVGRERARVELLVLKRSVVLGKRHRARVKPDVDHLADTAHLAAALAGERQLVDVGAVGVADGLSGSPFELREGADADAMLGIAVAAPQR